MSIETMSIVLHHSRAEGTTKLVLLGIANHAGDGGAWPTVATLAKYTNKRPRQVQRAVAELIALGELRVGVQAGGTPDLDDHRRPNLFHVMVTCPADCDRTPHHRTTADRTDNPPLWINRVSPTTPGVTHDTGGVSPTTPGGVSPTTPGGVSPTTPKPSIETTRETVVKRVGNSLPARPVDNSGHDAVYSRGVAAARAAMRAADGGTP